ncbi:putative flagellar basal body protein [Blattamonas nauphoetae]|uniref:Cilia- and flagella-associated protein 299 n=1 Tax=Blattamonas nauphoetae TaxID=2049346 RepID=A0ABQ9Y012_9EUKA|nr:putative flagellar basal body protein [Blattamonas nauphoetae]
MSSDLTDPSGGDGFAVGDRIKTYEDYLDSQISDDDLYFLEDQDLAREMVELGFRGRGNALKREDFEFRKRAAETLKKAKTNQAPQVLASEGKDLANFPFLQALAAREKLVREGRLAVIVFIRDFNSKGQEVSGYIDYGHRLKTEKKFDQYFERKAKLLPKPTDLSYYNWDTQTLKSNSSPNFEVIADNTNGLQFKSKRDRKTIVVDPHAPQTDKTVRREIQTHEYCQVVIFDHTTHRRT